MQSFERLFTRALFSVALFFCANIFLYFIDKEIPVNIITILFAVIFGWPAVLIMVVAIFLL
jgi:hypothetical protein